MSQAWDVPTIVTEPFLLPIVGNLFIKVLDKKHFLYMIATMNQINATTTEDAVKQLNKLRLDNKSQWVFAEVNINGLNYRFKFYNTWVQIAEDPNGMRDSSGMDISVKEFKDYLLDFFRK